MSVGNFNPKFNKTNNSEAGVLNGNENLEKGKKEEDSHFSKDFPIRKFLPDEINNKPLELDENGSLTENSKQKLINLWYAGHDFRTNKTSKTSKYDEGEKIEIIEPGILLGIDFDSYFKKALLLLKIIKRPDDDLTREQILDFHTQIIKDSIGESFLSVFDKKDSRDLFIRKVEFFFNAQAKLDAYIVRDGSIHINNNYFNYNCGSDKELKELLDDRNRYFLLLQSMIKTTEKEMFIKTSR